MTKENVSNIDPSWKGIIKWGGLSLFIAGLIVIIFIIGLGAFQITLPLDAEIFLGDPFVPTSLFIITVIGEFLLFPGMLALYFTLRNDDKVKMFMATALATFSVVMFLASRGMIFSVSRVSGSFKEAATESGRAAILSAVEVALETQDIYSTMALIFLSLAAILLGLVILRSKIFSKYIGYVAILSGIFSILTPFQVNLGFPIVISLIGLILMLVWQIIVGIKLFRLD